jgi:hypothetical protein
LLRLLVGVEVHFEWTRRGKHWWHDAVTMTRRLSRRFGLQKEINMGAHRNFRNYMGIFPLKLCRIVDKF